MPLLEKHSQTRSGKPGEENSQARSMEIKTEFKIKIAGKEGGNSLPPE